MCQLAALRSFSPGETMLAVLPFAHVTGMMGGLVFGLIRGCRTVLQPRFEFDQFLALVEKYRVERIVLVPPIVAAMARSPAVEQRNMSSIKAITCGAAPLTQEIQVACSKRLGCLVVQAYGMTETSVSTHWTPDDPSQVRPGSVGRPIPNVETRIVDPATGAELGPDQVGEIVLRGPNIMRGYLNRPDETARALDAEGWLRTGDLGYVDQDGYLFLVDRIKDLIKYKGYQIAPAELEEVLLSHPAIADAAVIPIPDREAGEIPKAFVTLRAPLTPEEVMAFVDGRVAPYKRVRKVEVIDSIPKLPSGKLLRRVLRERELAR
jgi:acyl-CoA synthetase (AMP-forming)/AMP-acid ligase II